MEKREGEGEGGREGEGDREERGRGREGGRGRGRREREREREGGREGEGGRGRGREGEGGRERDTPKEYALYSLVLIATRLSLLENLGKSMPHFSAVTFLTHAHISWLIIEIIFGTWLYTSFTIIINFEVDHVHRVVDYMYSIQYQVCSCRYCFSLVVHLCQSLLPLYQL